MHRSIEKGTARLRYAKFQPAVNRINGFYGLNPASIVSHHNYVRYDHCGPSNNLKTIKKQIDEGICMPKISALILDQSDEMVKFNQKKKKCRNKETRFCSSPPRQFDLKVELLDILNCIIFIMWSPIVFFLRFPLAFPSLLALVLRDMLNLFRPKLTNIISQRESKETLKSPKTGEKTSMSNENIQGKELEKKDVDNNFLHPSCHQDISSIELNNDCLSDKYSSRFPDSKTLNCGKNVIRRYQESMICNAMNEAPASLLKYSSRTASRITVDNRKERRNSKNNTDRRNRQKPCKNVTPLVPDCTANHNYLIAEFQREKENKDSPFMAINPKSLKSQTKASELNQALKSPSQIKIEESITRKEILLPRETDAMDASSMRNYKSENSMLKFQEFSALKGGPDHDESETAGREILPDVQTEASESHTSYAKCEKNFSRTKKLVSGLGDINPNKDIVSRKTPYVAAEFTDPIDAKAKWLEMKKKFYGKDYEAEKFEKPVKLETHRLTSVTSMTKLPPHKIFQYNMQMGRARQMRIEPLSTDREFSGEKITDSLYPSAHRGGTILTQKSVINLTRDAPQLLHNKVPIYRRVTQTQSLSQWPTDLVDCRGLKRNSTDKKYKQKPQPKPRLERFNRQKIATMSSSDVGYTSQYDKKSEKSLSTLNDKDQMGSLIDFSGLPN